ncbi:MAG: PAS domain S-box protein [Syntrophales bacterium]|nr:PAS domain S-box protein [Syntrophales bacterium]
MTDPSRTNQELIEEISGLKQRIQELEASEAERKRAEQEVTILAEIGRVIGSTLEIDEVYERMATEIRKLISFDSLMVNLRNAQQETLVVTYISGLDMPGRRAGDSFPMLGTIGEEAMRTKRGVVLQSENPEDLVAKFPGLIVSVRAGMRSVMTVPLIFQDKAIGNLIMRSKKPDAYSEDNLHLAEKIGIKIAGAIANAHLFNDLSKTEQSLRESEEKNRALFEDGPIESLVVDREGRVIQYNKAVERSAEKGSRRLPEIGRRMYVDYASSHSIDMRTELMNGIHSKTAKTFNEMPYKGRFLNISIAPTKEGAIISTIDVTERKQAAEELAKSHDLLANIARLVPGVIYQYRLHPDGRSAFPYSSPGMNDIYEATPEEVREDAAPVFGRLHPDDYDHVVDAIQKSARTLQTFYCEFRVILPRQGLRWRWSQAHPERLVDGSILWHGIISDITERKRAEEALRESEERYRQLVEYAPAGIYEADLTTGRLLSVNEVLCEYSGYTRDELLALNPLDLMTEESQKLILQRMAGYAAGEPVPPAVEYQARSKSGREFWISTHAKYFYQAGLPVRATVVAYDITERKRAEEMLRRTEANFRRFLEESPLGVRIVTAEGDTIYANRAILDIYGYDSIEELNTTPIKKRYSPESYAEFQIRMKKRKQGDDVPSKYEVSIVKKDGEIRKFQVFRKLTLWNGERQFQVIYNDITERKEAEEQLQASREQMRALAGRLQAVREEERTQIAREIHDELGGALTGLKIDFSLLTRAVLKIENETVRTSLLADMDSMIKFIDATIHTVRRIAMELRPGVLDDLGLVAALEWQLKDFEKRTGIRCDFFPHVEDIGFDADLSTALFRIFQEALTNVARHSGSTEVHVRLRADADSSTLEVEDNGKSIEKEKALSSKSLGLLGMRERAQMFGGRITVTGTPGRGTIVTVEIPSVEKGKMDRDQEGDAV